MLEVNVLFVTSSLLSKIIVKKQENSKNNKNGIRFEFKFRIQ